MIHHVMYLVVNQDLEMSPGKIGAHTAHAVFDEIPPHTHYFSCGLGGSFFILKEVKRHIKGRFCGIINV